MLRFDPSIGSHGAFYLTDDCGESSEATAPKTAAAAGLRHNSSESEAQAPRTAASASGVSRVYSAASASATSRVYSAASAAAAEPAQRPQQAEDDPQQRWQQFGTPCSAPTLQEVQHEGGYPLGHGGDDEGIGSASAGQRRPQSSCGSVGGSSNGTSGMLRMADALDALAAANAWGAGGVPGRAAANAWGGGGSASAHLLQQQQRMPEWGAATGSGNGGNVSGAGFESGTSGFPTSRSYNRAAAAGAGAGAVAAAGAGARTAAAGAGEREAEARPLRPPSSLMAGPRDGSDLRPAEHLQGVELQRPQQSAAGGGSSGGGLLFDDDSLVDILMQVSVEGTLMQINAAAE